MSRKIVVVGSSGNIGSAVIAALSAQAGEEKGLTIVAGVRDPNADKSNALKKPGVRVAHCDMNDAKSMATEFKGANAVFINTPGAENRTQLTNAAIDSAKAAGVSHVVVVSVPTVEYRQTVFGKQCGDIEDHLKSSGLNYTIARLPLFIDNLWGQQSSIKNQSAFYGNITGSKIFCPVVVEDAGRAIAEVLVHPTKYQNKAFTFNIKPTTHTEMAQLLSQELKRTITYHQVSDEQVKQSLLGMGMPGWQADGCLELNAFIESADPLYTTHTSDFQTVTGKQPMTAQEWIKKVAPGFQ